jgi:hypothetical protein
MTTYKKSILKTKNFNKRFSELERISKEAIEQARIEEIARKKEALIKSAKACEEMMDIALANQRKEFKKVVEKEMNILDRIERRGSFKEEVKFAKKFLIEIIKAINKL